MLSQATGDRPSDQILDWYDARHCVGSLRRVAIALQGEPIPRVMPLDVSMHCWFFCSSTDPTRDEFVHPLAVTASKKFPSEKDKQLADKKDPWLYGLGCFHIIPIMLRRSRKVAYITAAFRYLADTFSYSEIERSF